MGLVKSDFYVGDGLCPSEKFYRLPHGRDQVCPYTGPDTLAFWRVWESIEIHHGDSYISAWGLEYWLVSHHVESIIEVVRDQLSLLFFCPSLSTIGVALLALLPLIIGFPIKDWFVIADIEDQISFARGENWEAGKTRGYGGRSKW